MGLNTLQGYTFKIEDMGMISPKDLICLNIYGRNPDLRIMWLVDGPSIDDDSVVDDDVDEQGAYCCCC